MEHPIFVVGADGPVVAALADWFGLHPSVHTRFGVNVPGIIEVVRDATSLRAKHPDRPWDPDPTWFQSPINGYADFVLRFFRSQHGAARFCDGGPTYAFALSSLAEVMPAARFVHLFQDGREICAAALDGVVGREARLAKCVAVARDWSALVAAARDGMLAGGWGRSMEISLSAWRCSPEPIALAVLDFLGLEKADPMMASFHQLNAKMMHSYELTQEEQSAFLSWGPAKKMLESAGLLGASRPEASVSEAGDVIEVVEARADSWALNECWEEAEKELVDALKKSDDGRLWASLGRLYLRQNNEDACVVCLIKAVSYEQADETVWSDLLSLHHREETVIVSQIARKSPVLGVRAAAARWLVARGLDEEAAEVVTNVERQEWLAS